MEDEDKSSKTEEPTERKLRKAREQGNVPKSKEVNNLFMLGAMLGAIILTLPPAFEGLMNIYGGVFTEVGGWRANTEDAAGGLAAMVVGEALWDLIPTFLLFMVVALVGGMIQTGPMLSTHPIEPKLNKISLIKGFERMFSLKTLAEFLKTLFKMAVIGAAIYFVLFSARDALLITPDQTVLGVVAVVQSLLIRILLAAMAIMVLLAIVDFLFQKSQFTEEQKMSRKELRDELKETEGDPHIKARQRQIRMERARARMMQAVPEADVVITNPTHFSVALSYKPEEGMMAPVILAMGADHLAMRIREIATEHDIPLYEDPPLARGLYSTAEIGAEIPLDLYEATAKVIAFVMSLKKKAS